MAALTDQQQLRFDEDGFVVVRKFLAPELVDDLRTAADALVIDRIAQLSSSGELPSEVVATLNAETPERRLLRMGELAPSSVPLLFRAELHRKAFFRLFGNPKLLELVAGLLPEADEIRIFPNYSCRPKLPNFDPHEVVWHQDAGLAADGKPNEAPIETRMASFGPGRMVNVWTPLVEATPDTGCMKAIPGSHRLGIQRHMTARQYRDQEETHSYGRYATQIDPEVIAEHEACAVDLSCSPGDIILFSNILFHRGGFNKSNRVRWSFDWRYQDVNQPTLREEIGHIIYSRTNQDRVVKTPHQWEKLALT